LLNIDRGGRYELSKLMDLMMGIFASRMLVAQQDIRKIAVGFFRPVNASQLTVQDYNNVQTNLKCGGGLIFTSLHTFC
jgi:hypothetical protein